MPLLCFLDGLACRKPIRGEIVVRIEEIRPCLARDWGFPAIRVRVPRGIGECLQFILEWSENWVHETRFETLAEGCKVKFPRRHALPYVNRGHFIILLIRSRRTAELSLRPRSSIQHFSCSSASNPLCWEFAMASATAERDPRHHTQKMQKRLQEIRDHLREDIEKVD